MKRKLIEVALPLDAINAASAREKSIRHGHPSTLHLWWARKPLAACRAVLFAQLVDDPSSLPDEFPTEELQDAERQRLFGIIEELVKWENSTNEEVLNAARREILKSTDGNPPPVLDPFAGGGSIPLEAQRLGLEAYASDLNPVAVLINKALIEIPPKWADMPPVHPDAEQRTHWKGAEGLAEDVRLYGKWMRDEAERRIGHLYPKATLEDGSEANVIAWIWARTVTCPNPACGATMPLASRFLLSRGTLGERWVRPQVESDGTLAVGVGDAPIDGCTGTKVGKRGARFRCIRCESVAEPDEVHRQIDSIDNPPLPMPMAKAVEASPRAFLAVTDEDMFALDAAGSESSDALYPDQPARGTFGSNAQGRRYGFRRFGDYFLPRQRVALTTLVSLVSESVELARRAAEAAGQSSAKAQEYSEGVGLYLSFIVGRSVDYWSSLATWQPEGFVSHTFTVQGLGMTWDFAEANPLSRSSGSIANAVDWIARVIERLPAVGVSSTAVSAAQSIGERLDVVPAISTDPPYYDNVRFGDLADFFYVWLRAIEVPAIGERFQTMMSPKTGEIPRPESDEDGAAEFGLDMREVFSELGGITSAEVPATVFYAFKQSEMTVQDGSGLLVSTGWAEMLQAMVDSGWTITGTWPLRTERAARSTAQGKNSLASSVVLACRPRDVDAGLTDRQGFVRALHAELPDALHELQKAHIAPVDLRQAAIGPGMAVFSRYSRVVEADGDAMRVRTALGLINQVLDQVLGEQEAAFDPETRWAIQWFSQFFEDEGPFGVAESLATAMAISVDAMVASGILESGGGKVRLLGRDEYPGDWDPTADSRVPVWEACQHLVKCLEEQGEAAAGELMAQLGGLGESAQLLAYRLYTICEQTRPNLAGPYNALVASWTEIQQQATATVSREPEQGELL